jgi:hypothetical protein
MFQQEAAAAKMNLNKIISVFLIFLSPLLFLGVATISKLSQQSLLQMMLNKSHQEMPLTM